jgi:hypothetical protein
VLGQKRVGYTVPLVAYKKLNSKMKVLEYKVTSDTLVVLCAQLSFMHPSCIRFLK